MGEATNQSFRITILPQVSPQLLLLAGPCRVGTATPTLGALPGPLPC